MLILFKSLLILTVKCAIHFGLAESAASFCPSGLNVYDNSLCGIVISGGFTYCQAHATCHNTGLILGQRLFLMATNVTRFIKDPGFPPTAHTSINTLLVRNGNSRAGWRIGTPGYSAFVTSTTTDLPWYSNQPNGLGERVLSLLYAELHDISQFDRTDPAVCEWAGPGSTVEIVSGVEKFDAQFPQPLSSLFTPDAASMGCFRQVISHSLLSCAYM
ncbi:unnamed protein product [Echinostoma caproni]|uniref:Peptidase S1 domain-containing protein n=1 Tax=Echinostoma caproni TaxID=27848 RepID=A0A183A8W0_9TREM|nr:unnamed protein product [Echinostoma caproni]